jgi:hypothetical protein
MLHSVFAYEYHYTTVMISLFILSFGGCGPAMPLVPLYVKFLQHGSRERGPFSRNIYSTFDDGSLYSKQTLLNFVTL